VEKTTLGKYRRIMSDGLFGSVLPFWESKGLDTEYGGIRTCLDRQGNVFSAEKGVWQQGRAGWMLANLYRTHSASENWLTFSKSCLDFLQAHCIDPADGRLHFIVGDDGTPFRKRRYIFSEFFYIMACAEYYAATGDTSYLVESRRYYDFLTTIREDPSKDPFKITPKFLPTAPAMRGLAGDLVWLLVTRTMRVCDPENETQYVQTEKQLIEDIFKYHFKEEFGVLLESVGPNGEYIGSLSSGRIVNPGHCLEAVWYLVREAEELQDPALIERVERVYKGAMKHGWDQKYGGLLYFVDVEGNPPQAYEHDMKLWWVHNEAIISAIMLYRLTGKEEYLADFEKLMDYSLEHFCDDEFGEWYGYLRRDGLPTEPIAKGNIFKGCFHVPRMYSQVLLELNKLDR